MVKALRNADGLGGVRALLAHKTSTESFRAWGALAVVGASAVRHDGFLVLRTFAARLARGLLPRGPPRKTRPSQGVRPTHEADGGITYEVDPDFLEHASREVFSSEQPELPWDD